jgi:hypothetical protein
MKVFVTGTGSCGSTLLMQIFHKLGWDVGPDDQLNLGPGARRGMEFLPMAQLLTDLELTYSPLPLPPANCAYGLRKGDRQMDEFMQATEGKGAVSGFEQQVADVSAQLPSIVKGPALQRWLGAWIELGGEKPDLVIQCYRPMKQVIDSFYRDGLGPSNPSMFASWLHMSTGLLQDTLRQHEIHSYTVDFHRMITEPAHLNFMISSCGLGDISYDQFVEIHQAIVKPQLVHFS